MKKLITISIIVLTCFGYPVYSQGVPQTYKEARSGKLLYGLFVPEHYDNTKKYPLVMFLHGFGNDYFDYLDWYKPEFQAKNPCFVFSPRCPKTWVGWSSWNNMGLTESTTLAMKVLDSLASVYSIDTNRLYVYGISMGGEGTFNILYEKPGKFAAAMSVCGGGNADWATNISKTPFWMFHGSADPINTPDLTERVYNKMVAIGAHNMRYTSYPGYGHEIWDEAASEPSWMDWMFSFSKADTSCPIPNQEIMLESSRGTTVDLRWNDIRSTTEKANKIWYYDIFNKNGKFATVEFNKQNYEFTPTSVLDLYHVEAVNYCGARSRPSNLNPSDIISIELERVPSKLYLNTPFQFVVKGYDNSNIETMMINKPTWTVNGGGAITQDGLFTPTTVGEFTIKVSYPVKVGEVSTTALISISEPVITRISISPDTVKLTINDTCTFVARGYDLDNNLMNVTPVWSVTGGGVINSKGIFTATRVGTFVVTASHGGKTAEAVVKVMETPACSVVGVHGLLTTRGKDIIDKNGNTFGVAGMSLPWSTWSGEYYNASLVKWMKNDFKSGVIRVAMGVEDGGYIANPETEKNKVTTVVDAAIEAGIYVIIDWHDPDLSKRVAEATSFFQQMARTYGNYPNVMYEVNNEPGDISWKSDIKPYAETVIKAIRSIDPDNMIIVNVPKSSNDVMSPANDPITGYSNVAYAFHVFLGSSSGTTFRQNVDYALGKNIPLMVTEWAVWSYDMTLPEIKLWKDFFIQRKLSNCAWTINNVKEEASILEQGASSTGGWTSDQLTPTGDSMRLFIRNWDKETYEGCQVLDTIIIHPLRATIGRDSSLQFTLKGLDESGKEMSIIPVWSSNGGTISASGIFKPGNTAGTFTIHASVSNMIATATVTVKRDTVLSSTTCVDNIHHMEVFPNPVNDELYITNDLGAGAILSVLDNLGKQVLLQSLQQGITRVRVETLLPGTYFVTLTYGTTSVTTTIMKK